MKNNICFENENKKEKFQMLPNVVLKDKNIRVEIFY